MSTPAPPSMEQIKAGMRAQWMAGDFGIIARSTAEAAATFARRLAQRKGSRVLDIACGTGNVAVPLAQEGYEVTGVDLAPNLLAQAEERAQAEGLRVRFDEGDAEALPYADGAFDAVVSMFGAMFAPRPELVVREMARVLRPGGTLLMANWNPESFTGAMFRTSARHAPPPPGLQPPVLWGDTATVRERLAGHFHNTQLELIPIEFDFPEGPAGVVSLFRSYFGPTQTAFGRLDDAGKAALAADLEALWSGANVANDPGQHTFIRNQYLEVRALRS